jgi:hypothetical protein
MEIFLEAYAVKQLHTIKEKLVHIWIKYPPMSSVKTFEFFYRGFLRVLYTYEPIRKRRFNFFFSG